MKYQVEFESEELASVINALTDYNTEWSLLALVAILVSNPEIEELIGEKVYSMPVASKFDSKLLARIFVQ